ncbi:MAG: hypothetical protein QOG50_2353 [Actinomycetota bacterium]|nr:hypothetical protein [Actinomycetota bacterium]
MPDIHVSMLALHIPNVLPKTVPWIDFARHKGIYINDHSQWVRHAGRMIWATLIFAIGIVIAFRLTKKPKRAEPATWAQTILGAMCMWAMMALGYGTIPHEWLKFGTAYLYFNTATYVMRQNRFIHFDITRSVVIDIGTTVIYGMVLVLQVWLIVLWQKRPALEPAAETEAAEADSTGSGPLARLLRRREKRVSAYGRPVTTVDS